MNKVSLTLESTETPATVLEERLEALKEILRLTTKAKATVTVLEED